MALGMRVRRIDRRYLSFVTGLMDHFSLTVIIYLMFFTLRLSQSCTTPTILLKTTVPLSLSSLTLRSSSQTSVSNYQSKTSNTEAPASSSNIRELFSDL